MPSARVNTFRISAVVDTTETLAHVIAQGAPGRDGGGVYVAEFLSETSARVWNLSQIPLSGVAIWDGNPLRNGYDYTISGTVVTFLIIDPVAPYATYTA